MDGFHCLDNSYLSLCRLRDRDLAFKKILNLIFRFFVVLDILREKSKGEKKVMKNS